VLHRVLSKLCQGYNIFNDEVKFCLCYDTDVEDVHSSRSFVDGGAFLTLPMFYLEGEF